MSDPDRINAAINEIIAASVAWAARGGMAAAKRIGRARKTLMSAVEVEVDLAKASRDADPKPTKRPARSKRTR